MISPERQTFKCFGCGEGGDVITFVEKIEGLDFYNALKLLAEKAGVKLQTSSVKYGEKEFTADKKTRLFEINEWAKKVYQKILLDHPKAEKAREYLKNRGLSQKTIEEFEMGYAPNSWDFLLRFLVSKKYSEEEIVAAGVGIKADRGKVYDRFRGRIIFPINNIMGSTVAFTSRILEDDGQSAKYINSAESQIYIKGKTIYGLDKAKLFIKEKDLSVMVEGNMDVIACHQAGFKNVVATSGTALTLDQLKVLTRYSSVIALSFDSDEAGQTAMKRAIRVALQNDISTKIISLPKPFKDPDEAIKKDPKNWEKAVAAAKPSLQYWIDSLLTKYPNLSIDEKKNIAREILPAIKITASSLEKEHYIKYLSSKLFISENSLIEALDKTKGDTEFARGKKESGQGKKSQLEPYERILGLVWANDGLLPEIKGLFVNFKNDKAEYGDFTQMVASGYIDRSKLKPEVISLLNQLSLVALADIDPSNKEILASELAYLTSRFRSDERETIKEKYARLIQAAEEKGDQEEIKNLLKEFSNLIK